MKKIVFVFPGQGSQYIGMGKNLWEENQIVKDVYAQANEVLGFDLAKLSFEGDIEELTKTENAQPALLTLSVAMYQLCMQKFNVLPSYFAGHSLGEYSALVCCGAMDFKDALNIVRKRGQFMQEAVPAGEGSMAAVIGIDAEVIKDVCKEVSSQGKVVVLANDNSPVQKVISGHIDGIKKASDKLEELGGTVKILNVSGPFHSPLMKPAADKLKNELMKYKYNPFQIPVIANVTALPYQDETEIIDGLTKQIESPVLWCDTMKFFEDMQVDYIVEMGPKVVLKKLVKANVSSIKAFSFDHKNDVVNLESGIFLKKVDLKELDPNMTVITRCMAMAVATKNNNFEEEEYNKGVVTPYKTLKRMQEDLEEQGKEPDKEQMIEALNLLKVIFETKGVSKEEQKERFHRILCETNQMDLEKEVQI